MQKSDFTTQFRKPVRVLSIAGSGEKDTFSPVFDDKGNWHLVKTGKKDLYGEIQSHAESVDINVLVKRFQKGDVDVFSRMQGIYGDFSDMPETMIEAVNRIEQGRINFMQLPPEIREHFDNSFEKMLAAMDKPGFLEEYHDLFYSEKAPAQAVEEDKKGEE